MTSTDNARAEAWRRFPDGIDVETGEPVDDYGYPATAREAFIGGAEWAAGRAETATAADEDALADLAHLILDTLHFEPSTRDAEMDDVMGVLRRHLLATARTRPTREELSTLILSFLKPPKYSGGSWTLNPDDAADAVLALLNNEGD